MKISITGRTLRRGNGVHKAIYEGLIQLEIRGGKLFDHIPKRDRAAVRLCLSCLALDFRESILSEEQ